MCKVCTEAVLFRSTLNTNYITGLDMCAAPKQTDNFRRNIERRGGCLDDFGHHEGKSRHIIAHFYEDLSSLEQMCYN